MRMMQELVLMVQLITTSSRIKIWRYSNLPTGAPMQIDPDGPTNPDTGQLLGYLTKRIIIKAGTANENLVRVWDQSTSPEMYYELAGGDELEMWVDSSLLPLLSGSAASQVVYVYMELQVGGQ